MKQNNNIANLFKKLKDEWDIETPQAGHENRFLEKLQTQEKVISIRQKKLNKFQLKLLSVAASITILVVIGFQFLNTENLIERQVVEKPTQIEKTEFYFVSLINKEVEKIKAESTPETKQIIVDCMLQLKKLEKDYKKLEEDLANEGNSKQILHAMIINYQTRINLLQDVLTQIEYIKQFKTTLDEYQIT